MGFRRRAPEPPRVDLTPMIDVVFLLLIFFMISTTFIERPGLTIDLPDAGSDRMSTAGDREVRVYLDQQGRLYLNGDPISGSALRQHLLEYGVQAGKMSFVLMADEAARHGRVVALMDAAQVAGFGELAIATEKKPSQLRETP